MNIRSIIYVCLTVLGAYVSFEPQALAQTRLGLHVTQEELNVWRARMTDNVNTINGFTYQAIYNARIKADADSFVAQSHPGGDGRWTGWTGVGCQPGDDSVDPGSGGTPFSRGNGAWMMRSAFNFLLTGTASYANPVRTELLSQIAQAGTDFTNTSKWCSLTGSNAHTIVPWINRLVVAYDYLVAGGYTGFSAGEHTAIKAWFTTTATVWANAHVNGVTGGSSYPGVYNTPQNFSCFTNCTAIYGTSPTHLGGWNVHAATQVFFNQSMPHMSLAMAVGVMTSNSKLIDIAAKWFRGFITSGVYDDGAVFDFVYWADGPGSMWGHSAGDWSGLTAMADMLARTGDRSLYDYSVANQTLGGKGGTVSLRKVAQLTAALATGATVYRDPNNTFDLTWDELHMGNQGEYYHDFSFMLANMYYRDSGITAAMNRASFSGTNTSSGCYDPRFAGCFSGIWAQWADLPFMYGNMEGKVNPYVGSRGASVSLTESPSSITSGQSSTLSWFSSDVTSCTASGGWTGSKATSGTQTVSPTQTTTYTLTCTGSVGSASASANVTILSPLTQVRINSGGPAYTGTDGTYEADRYASGENTYITTESIANTPDPTLYQTVQYGDFTYEIPMANGTYNVTLKFAEVSRPGVGQRVFNVDINGTQVLSNFDIVAQAGSGYRAIDRTFPATVSNGLLSIAFGSVVDNAMVNAIEVNPYGTVLSPPSDLRLISAQ